MKKIKSPKLKKPRNPKTLNIRGKHKWKNPKTLMSCDIFKFGRQAFLSLFFLLLGYWSLKCNTLGYIFLSIFFFYFLILGESTHIIYQPLWAESDCLFPDSPKYMLDWVDPFFLQTRGGLTRGNRISLFWQLYWI